MSNVSEKYYKEVDSYLAQGYQFLEELGFEPLSEEEKYYSVNLVCSSFEGEYLVDLATACQCFYMFRKLHQMVEDNPEGATLLGDYFFSRFSHHLIPIDSTRLIDKFSQYLAQDTQKGVEGNYFFDKEKYEEFIKEIPSILQYD